MAKFRPKSIVKSGSTRLLSLINLDETTPDPWNPDDIAAMVRHQFMAPLDFDLSAVEETKTEGTAPRQTLTQAATAHIRTFEDLLFHAEPPLELLRLSKEFFKSRTQSQRKDSPEWQVAYLFYLLSILVGRRRDPRISGLTRAELLRATEWALSRVRVDRKTRKLLAQARKRLLAEG